MTPFSTELFTPLPPVPATNSVPAGEKGRLRLTGSHWVGGPQHRHLLPPVHFWQDLPRLPGQDGRQDQNLEETLVCLWPQPTDALLLCRCVQTCMSFKNAAALKFFNTQRELVLVCPKFHILCWYFVLPLFQVYLKCSNITYFTLDLQWTGVFTIHSACIYVTSSTDKHEAKLKGVIYFQAIEEVYYDHLKSAHKVSDYVPEVHACHLCYIFIHSISLLVNSSFSRHLIISNFGNTLE